MTKRTRVIAFIRDTFDWTDVLLLLAIALCVFAPATSDLSCHVSVASAQSAPLAQAAPKPVYDAMHYQGQPDLRPLGLTPLYILDDGVLYRATGLADDDPRAIAARDGWSFRRVARAAIGVEDDLPQSSWKLPPAYNRVPRPVCIDFEADALIKKLDAAADPRDRVAAVDWLCRGIDAMRDEAATYKRPLSIGAYTPILPYAAATHPADVKFPGWIDAAERDWRPLFERLDVAYPPCEIHSADLEKWKRDTRASIDKIKRLMPGKPIVPLVPPHYSHYSEESIRWKIIPRKTVWQPAIEWLLEQPEVAGVAVWGGTKMKDNPDGVTRDPFTLVSGHVRLVVEAASGE